MKILAFTDIHSNSSYLKEVYKKFKNENPDIIICSGDISFFSIDIKKIKRNLEKFDKIVLLIHGNHETPKFIDKLCSKNIINIHKKIFEFQGLNFVGYGGGGFEYDDKNLEEYFNNLNYKLKNWVLITHAPPFDTKLDVIGKYHVGSKSIKRVIEKFRPILEICGHLHENFYIKDKKNQTLIINPGPKGTIIEI